MFYRVDFAWEGKELPDYYSTILRIGELNEIWGQGLPQPQVFIRNVTVSPDNLILMSPDRSPTLKIILEDGITILKFKSSKEEFESLRNNGVVKMDIVGTCNVNEWMGSFTPQIFITDYEIKRKATYYF